MIFLGFSSYLNMSGLFGFLGHLKELIELFRIFWDLSNFWDLPRILDSVEFLVDTHESFFKFFFPRIQGIVI